MQDNNQCICSIIIPTYNAQKYIRDTLNSVINQTLKENIEIIIIDDASTDSTVSIIKDYQNKYPNVYCYINQNNKGVAVIRNQGFELARGKYIALLDSDDIWIKNKLEKQIEFMEQAKCDISYTAYELIDDNNEKVNKVCSVPQIMTYNQILKENSICVSSTMLKKEVVKVCKMDSVYAHEDLVFWISALKQGYKLEAVQDMLVQYRVAKGSRSNNKILAAKGRWDIYSDFLRLPIAQRIYYFSFYIINGIKKYY